MTTAANEIIKILGHCEASGNRSWQVYRDFIDLTEATLEMLPAHVTAAVKTGKMAEDSPKAKKLWGEVRGRYNVSHRFGKKADRGYFDLFAEAFGILLDAAVPIQVFSQTGHNPDILGEVYMLYGSPNSWKGQFFTPWSVALMMAKMTVGPEDVNRRLKAAAVDDPLVAALTLAATVAPVDIQEQWFLEHILPATLPLVEPLTVCDPCCGSGVMLLAAASQFPAWQLAAGLVKFYGQDLDYGCVQMAKINCTLYGLNNALVKSALELSAAELARLPSGARQAYTLAQQADKAGRPERVKELARQLRAGTAQQMPMFGIPGSA